MKLQIIQHGSGKNAGVFIPMEDWNLIQSIYPDVTHLQHELPQWQKDLIDSRLDEIAANPERVKPIETLFDILKKEE
ncbi:MAG TPA: addiction module protein [Hanamia sp.]|nr:addiction module protein [Hanamia sp.]